MNSKVREYVLQQHRLHQLEKQGRGNSDHAEFIRDLMEELWREMSSDEAAQVNKETGGVKLLAEDDY